MDMLDRRVADSKDTEDLYWAHALRRWPGRWLRIPLIAAAMALFMVVGGIDTGGFRLFAIIGVTLVVVMAFERITDDQESYWIIAAHPVRQERRGKVADTLPTWVALQARHADLRVGAAILIAAALLAMVGLQRINVVASIVCFGISIAMLGSAAHVRRRAIELHRGSSDLSPVEVRQVVALIVNNKSAFEQWKPERKSLEGTPGGD